MPQAHVLHVDDEETLLVHGVEGRPHGEDGHGQASDHREEGHGAHERAAAEPAHERHCQGERERSGGRDNDRDDVFRRGFLADTASLHTQIKRQ